MLQVTRQLIHRDVASFLSLVLMPMVLIYLGNLQTIASLLKTEIELLSICVGFLHCYQLMFDAPEDIALGEILGLAGSQGIHALQMTKSTVSIATNSRTSCSVRKST